MKRNVALLLLLLLPTFNTTADSYQRLLLLINNTEVSIKPFATDGCSGGMSSLWNLFDQSPPWEYCCIIHDQAYWQGGHSEQRLKADHQLKLCVKQAGFPVIAGLMYQAVRSGGGPCTRLPWRWGFGWPHC